MLLEINAVWQVLERNGKIVYFKFRAGGRKCGKRIKCGQLTDTKMGDCDGGFTEFGRALILKLRLISLFCRLNSNCKTVFYWQYHRGSYKFIALLCRFGLLVWIKKINLLITNIGKRRTIFDTKKIPYPRHFASNWRVAEEHCTKMFYLVQEESKPFILLHKHFPRNFQFPL